MLLIGMVMIRADRLKLQRLRRSENYARPARLATQSQNITTKRTSHRAPQNVGLRGQFRKSWIGRAKAAQAKRIAWFKGGPFFRAHVCAGELSCRPARAK